MQLTVPEYNVDQPANVEKFMKHAFLGKAFIVATALVLAAPASAKVYQMGDLLSPSTVATASGNTGRHVVRANKTHGNFRDTFKFDLSKDADVNLTRMFGGGKLGKQVQWSSVRMKLLDSENNVIARVRGGRLASFAGSLDEGSYQVRIGGKLKPSFGRGAYKFSAGAIAAPVPEPEEWALMILGAGLMGYQVRRKQRQLAVESETPLTALPA